MTRDRALVWAVLALATLIFALQVLVLRPRLWPAGAGLAVSGDTIFGGLGEPRSLAMLRPPDVDAARGRPVIVTRVWPGGPADLAGVKPGMVVTALGSAAGPIADLSAGIPADAEAALLLWRRAGFIRPEQPITLDLVEPSGRTLSVTLERPSIVGADPAAWWEWLRQHLGRLLQFGGFLAGAGALLLLGARGPSAKLMTLALIATAVADDGPLLGAEWRLGPIGPLLVGLNWIVTPLAFPIIGLAVLLFPRRAEMLDRHRWVVPLLFLATLPMLSLAVMTVAFLLGADEALPALAWRAARPWTFQLAFGIAMGVNLLIAAEGVRRYRRNPDIHERRRIQLVVFTGVPAVFAYAVKIGIPQGTALLGHPVELPWLLSALLQTIILLPAVGLPYAVAVRHVFSPRTVLRRSLQYAFAQRTLAVLTVLPVVALVIVLVQQRDRSLSAIVSGQPLFYLVWIALIGWSIKYRRRAERWLDQKFFRAEYDAREILMSLASRVPYEADPRTLVSIVLAQVESALHPETAAVLAANGSAFETVASRGTTPASLPTEGALATLLRWSDAPLEVFLGDPQSPANRLPEADRRWLAAADAALLVPIVAGTGSPRPLVGVILLGRKRSEERYTTEDRQLLAGIADQMGVALDLSRLRRQAGSTGADVGTPPSAAAAAETVWPERGVQVGVVVDGKYRVDALIGRGGMGAVYRARDLRLERDVAIKIVRPELVASADARERFQREARLVARLQHPAIVTVFDYGTLPDGAAFLVMEYVRGEDLRARLRREVAIPLAIWTPILTAAATGVEAAHAEGVLHRDLKPENILLPTAGTGPKVLDFGVAKAMAEAGDEHTLTIGGTVVGTPSYMAPEQLRGDRVDARADVYSLGVMSYEALTGRLPFGTGSLVDIALRQADARQLVDMTGLSPAVGEVILRAMAYDRDERSPTPLAFAEALARTVRS